jgi:hypothetical protein
MLCDSGEVWRMIATYWRRRTRPEGEAAYMRHVNMISP